MDAAVPGARHERGSMDAQTVMTRWRGEKIDHGLGMEVLVQKAGRRRLLAVE